MSQIVKLRRSSVSGQKPTNTNLQLGELALNTTDGKVYMAKSGSLGPSVEELISTNTVNTGSINLIGDITGSNISSSFIGDGGRLYNIPLSGVTNLTTISGSIDTRLDALETLSQSFTGSISGSMTGSIYADYIVFNSSSAAPLVDYMLQANTTDKTLDLRMGNNATIQLGQELLYPPIVNKSGGLLPNGALVMFNPADPTQGNRISVVKCVSNGTYPAEYIVGILTEDVAVNAEGFATWFGYVRDVSRTELESAGLKDSAETWAEGQILYPHPTRPGGLTNVQPIAPNLKSSICAITSINGINITFLVRPQLRGTLKGLHDVIDTTTTSTYGDLLVKSGSVWKNSKSLNGDYTVTGSLTITQNLTVLGSSSLVYVTSSNLAVSASFISVNVFEPAERFGGLKVYDSGSSNATASLAWDSLNNHWVYQNASDSSYSGGMLLAGPRNSGSLGDEVGLINGRIAKSVGGDHLDNSIMHESGSNIIIDGHLNAFSLTGSLNFGDLTDLPTLVSGSPQISYTGITDTPNGIVSGSSQIINLGFLTTGSFESFTSSYTTDSSSFDSRINTITGSIDEFTAFTSVINSFTSSVVLTSQTSSMSVLTSSYALTASFALNAGGGTEGRTARLDQTTPSTTWTFNHNLGEQYPTVTIYDSNDEVIIPQTISADSNNTLTITFPSAQSGHAVATVGGGLPFISSSFDNYVLSAVNNAPTWKGGIVSGSLQITNLGYATTGSNIFTNNQTINGTLSITNALVKQTTTTGVTTNTVVSSLPTGSYDGGFFDYVIKNGTNMRAGTITSVWSSSNIEFNEVTTNDLGNTSNVVMSMTLSNGNANLNSNISSGTWTIKVLSRGL